MKKMNFYSNSNKLGLLCMMMIAVFITRVSAQCPPVNFSYPAPGGVCAATAPLVVSGLTAVEVNKGGAWVATLDKNDIGKTLDYRGIQANGAMCWNTVTVEDKAKPVIVCPLGVNLTCASAANAYDLAIVGDFMAGGLNNGTYTDCSPIATQSYNDVRTDYGCGATVDGTANVLTKIVRTWTVKDKSGNISEPCIQNIYVLGAVAGKVDANDQLSLSCTVSLAGFATEVGDGTGGTLYRPTLDGAAIPNVNAAASCDFYAVLKNVMVIDICGGGKSYMRTWQVLKKCDGTMLGLPFVQTVTVKDVAKPTGSISVDDYNLVAGTPYCFSMTGMPLMENLVTKNRAFSQKTQALGGAAISVYALADQTTCLMGAVRFTLKDLNATNCAGFTGAPRVRVSDSRLSLSGGVWSGTFMFASATERQSFTVTVTDDCGNETVQTVNVDYQDNAAPNAICKPATLTIPVGSAFARLNVNSINNSSTDNCGIKSIMMRKMTASAQTGTTNCYADVLDYACSEVGKNMVILRIVDNNDIVNECMIEIQVDLKPSVFCTNLPAITRVCTSPDLLNFKALFGDIQTSVSGSHPASCLAVTAKELVFGTLAIGCTSTTVERTWQAEATVNGVKYTSGVCSQMLTVTPVRGFRVTRLADLPVTCVGAIPTLKQDQDAIIASMRLTHSRSAAPRTIAGLPSAILGDDITTVVLAGETTCSAPVVDTTESIYRNSEFCKVIVRTFIIKDICDFSTVNSSITQGNVYDRVTASGLVAESVVDAQGRHFIKFTRTITVRDTDAPTPIAPANQDICVSAGCNFDFTSALDATDVCGAAASGSALFYTWTIVNATGGTVKSGTGKTVGATGLAFGTYTVFFRVADLCGNLSTEKSYTIVGKDCKAPQILVHNKIGELAGQRGSGVGMLELLYIDIRNNVFDNCDGNLTNDSKITLEKGGVTAATRPAAVVGTQSVMYGCTELGVQKLRVWAVDANGNWNYAISDITIQDNIGSCTVSAQAAGLVGTENGSVVKDVVVSANANGLVAAAATSTATGGFRIDGLTVGTNYQVRAVKTIDTDKKNGVTTADIAMISKHLLGETELNSAYKIIAADVDKSQGVDATDMLHIRRFILGITSNLPAGSAWRFIDKSYTFRNTANPLGEDFPEVVSLSSIPAGTNAANFTAVKLGDVNNSYDASTVRGSRALSFNAADMTVVAGNEYTVAINADNFNASAFQGTFAFEGATVKAVKAGNLNNASDNNFGMFANAVSASWNGKSEATTNVVNITFVATKSGLLSEMLTVNSSVAMAEGYDAAGNAMNVSLKFNTGKVAGGEFALYQNTPNPVAASTTIGFNLPKDGQAKLTIYTAEGKVLSVINNTYKAGVNQIAINKADLNASGMLYYRLDTQDNSSTRKMIIIE